MISDEFNSIETAYINNQDPSSLPPMIYKDEKITAFRLGFGDWKIDDELGSHYFSVYPEEVPGLEYKADLTEKENHKEFVRKAVEEAASLVYHEIDMSKIVFDF